MTRRLWLPLADYAAKHAETWLPLDAPLLDFKIRRSAHGFCNFQESTDFISVPVMLHARH
jgi:hypothetical protein